MPPNELPRRKLKMPAERLRKSKMTNLLMQNDIYG